MMGAPPSKYSRFWLLAYMLFFVALSFAKAPRVLIEPRFWAEDGAYYFAHFRALDPWSALLYVTNGNYQFLTNVLVYLATQAPLVHAPTVTTYGAYLVGALVLVLIYAVVASYGINRVVGLLVVAAWTLMPASYETFASATNVQWLCSITMLFILVLPQKSIEHHFGKLAVWTVMCGLTGVTSCMLAPAYLVRAWADRSRQIALLSALLIDCALIQLWVLVSHGMVGRAFPLDPRLLTIPTLLQTIFTPVLGVEAINALSAPLRAGEVELTMFVYLVGLSLMALASALALRAQRAVIVFLIAALWVLVSLLNTFGAIEDPLKRISATDGGRYFLFGSMCFCLLLAFGTTGQTRSGRIVAAALLGIIVATSVVGRVSGTWAAFYTEGPSWESELKKCDPAAPCTVAIWPRGWTMTLHDQRRQIN